VSRHGTAGKTHPTSDPPGCGGISHWNRRTLLRAAGLSGFAWLTPLAQALARAQEQVPGGAPAKSVIVLWLQGGPSQLETFDPHPNAETGGLAAIETRAPGVKICELYPRLAEQMDLISLVRSVVSKEGDHERATYNLKTGYRPDPTLIHPSIGAVICHQLRDDIDLPRHVSILPNVWAARGGYLGDQFDAFKVSDPIGPVPFVTSRVPEDRYQRRLANLTNVLEAEFARGRIRGLDERRTLHQTMTANARRLMDSEQLKAFDVREAPESLRKNFGDTPFGRACLVAARLVKAGVRCVEVTLAGWDTHANNHDGHRTQAEILDPAFAALLQHLREDGLLNQTLVLCGGEFGRTPAINPLGGRDHWPHGFTIALAGGGIAGGRVIGETNPRPDREAKDPARLVSDPRGIADIHATILRAIGIEFDRELITPIGRPMKLSDGRPIDELLA